MYTFTQEWPFRGMRNQLSYTIPALHNNGIGIGDIQLNYRLQAVGNPDGPVALAPRLTAILADRFQYRISRFRQRRAAASPARQHPSGAGAGLPPECGRHLASQRQESLRPVGIHHELQPRRQRNLVGQEPAQLPDGMGLAGCGTGGGERWYSAKQAMLLNPGVRVGFDFESGLQIVPGVAYTVGVGPSDG